MATGPVEYYNIQVFFVPWSLFLYNHLLPSSVSSLSCPKAALTKPFTKEEAKFIRAESTWEPLPPNPVAYSTEVMQNANQLMINKTKIIFSKNKKHADGLTVVFQVCFVDIIWDFGFHDVQLGMTRQVCN